jgi:hypothetical protein
MARRMSEDLLNQLLLPFTYFKIKTSEIPSDPLEYRQKLEELQKFWYKKLKTDGFQDIETTHLRRPLLKSCHSNYFQIRYHPDVFQAKEEYYRKASIFLWEYSFESPLEKEIWKMHAEGLSLREIASILKDQKTKTNKDKINKTVVKLAKIMKSLILND